MDYFFSRKRIILPSLTDYTAKMGAVSFLSEYMDIATYHAEQLGIGLGAMAPKGLFWLTAKTRIKILRRPSLLEEITVTTWPGRADGTRYPRFYSAADGKGIVSEGMTEWVILDTSTGRPLREQNLYPFEEIPEYETPCSEPFTRFTKDVSDTEYVGYYTVRSTDIDLGGHMNNVAYMRALLSLLPTSEIDTLGMTEIELQFRSSIYEGQTVEVRKRAAGTGAEFYFVGTGGNIVFYAKIGR